MKQNLDQKIFLLDDLVRQRKIWKYHEEICVFTNGCFDLLHEGHVRYLHEAKSLGHRLIIGLNSDASVRKLKGPTRPINFQDSRAIVLAALESVDAVIIFNEETPIHLIQQLMPDILVKGGDWSVDQIVGAQEVIEHGGKVFSLRFHNGFSTTLIEQKLKSGT